MVQEVPEGLFEKVMVRVSRERVRAARQRFAVSTLAAVATASAAVPVWNMFQTDLAQSGFTSYLPLLFSDFQTVMNNGQDFVLSLLESFPLMDVIALSLVAVAFVTVVRRTVMYGQIGFHKYATA